MTDASQQAGESLDTIFARIERLAAALPETVRTVSDGTPSLAVDTKTFVRLKDADTLVLMCPVEQKALLLEVSPEIYFEDDSYVGWPAILIRLSAIDDEELALRLEDSWRFKAPKTLADRPADQ